jgi:asparagine synthase (glutamine-hydrolysing)
MGARLRHRGPDDAGVYVDGAVGLAHQRLSILDVSAAGHQPMSNEDQSIWIVFNGEIYNYRELRAHLEGRHEFRSNTDTEVLVHLYEDEGVECFSKLRGMFAVAIWDARLQQLVIARDRLGKKPVFYSLGEDGALSFASELKALVGVEHAYAVDPLAVHHYLTFQYIPTPQTIYQNVAKLKPGHVLVYRDGSIREQSYWSLQFQEGPEHRSEGEIKEQFLSVLDEAVRLRMISDVPLGAFLSGGVDSSSVVARMSRWSPTPVNTFSIGFREDAFNELPYARQVAERYHTNHHEFLVEPSALDLLPRLVGVYDEPFADSSAIPTYVVSQLSRAHVTVVLTGDGGDEILAGYPRYQFSSAELVCAGGRTWRSRWKSLVSGWPGPASTLPSAIGRFGQPLSRRYLSRIAYFSPQEKEALYTEDFLSTVGEHDSAVLLDEWFAEVSTASPLNQLLGVDTRSYLLDDLLVKVDRATMAHGLEARSPFLDHQVVEFCAALPLKYKLQSGIGKVLLKSVMRGTLSDDVLDRPKMGFGVPIERWFRDECREFLRDTLLSKPAAERGYFKPERVRDLIDDHEAGRGNYAYRLYALLMLELWHQHIGEAVMV